jgi:hypothetical protein
MTTFQVELPTEEELTVPEVNISSPALRAGAFHLGKHCENQNNVSLILLHHHKEDKKFKTTNFMYFFRNICYVVLNLMIQENV